MARKHLPDCSTVGSSVRRLISGQNRIARIDHTWMARRTLEPVDYQLVGNCLSNRRSEVPQSSGPDFAVVVDFKSLIPDVLVRKWVSIVTETPNSTGVKIGAHNRIVEEAGGKVIGPPLTPRARLNSSKTAHVRACAD